MEATVYPGGKGAVFRRLINQIPPHERYFELFLGDGAVMRNKRPAGYNLGLDLDATAVDCVAAAIATNGDDTRRLGAIAGNGDAAPASQMTMTTAVWEFRVGDALEFLQTFDFLPGDFVYLDPPYLMQTRKQQRALYAFEFGTKREHLELLTAVLALAHEVKFMISGYWSELYAVQLHGWRTDSFTAVTRGGTLATEYIWMNYPQPVRLHDYSWLGDNFRERERIGRKARRWVAGLRRLPVLEQQAIMAEMKAAGLVD